MCGICGIVHVDPARAVDPDILAGMRDVLRHRGPDDAGSWTGPGIGLGHRRLAIIDLSSAGRQPMSNEDGSVWVTYNGEIYNYAGLRRELLAAGHAYRTKTDTEVLVHLYEDRGDALVDRLRGMFAFAIWDRNARRLLLVRDRLGIKPLYYALSPQGDLVFGSEIKSLLASRLVEAQLSPPALSEYLANRYTTGTETLYANVQRLLPGHLAVWQDGVLRVREWWNYPTGVVVDERSDDTIVADFRERFHESVKLRMISDAPIGVFLSGGIDSSAIAEVMAMESPSPIRTFSVAFAEREANELRYARDVSNAFQTEHHEVVVSQEEFVDAIPKLVWHEDEPIAHPSSVALYFVSKLAAQSVKVVLTGEGADELLAGYGKYWRALYNLRLGNAYSFLPGWLRAATRNGIAHLPRHSLSSKVARTFLGRECTLQDLYLASFSVFDTTQQQKLLTPDIIQAAANGGVLDPFAGHRVIAKRLEHLPMLNQFLALDVATYLQELLMKQDQMSMAASIESRVPFLDHELVEFATRLPLHLKLRGTKTKRVLRLAVRDVLPKSVLSRGKMGFPTPVGTWLQGPYAQMFDDLVLSKRARERGIFQPAEIQRLVREHRQGLVDHTERLWALLTTEIWFRKCIDRESTV